MPATDLPAAPSTSQRTISRFLWINVIATVLGCILMALTFNHASLLIPAVFAVLLVGAVLIIREMFSLIGDDTYGDDAPKH